MNPYEFSSDPDKAPLKHKGQDPLAFILLVLLMWYLFSKLVN